MFGKMDLSPAMQFECNKMGSSELGWWRIDYIIFKDLETASSGKCYLFLLCTLYFLWIIDRVVEDSCGFIALPLILWNGLSNKIFRSCSFSWQGGIFVLEPQPWKSYENNRLVSEVIIFFASLNDSYFIYGQLIKCLFINM